MLKLKTPLPVCAVTRFVSSGSLTWIQATPVSLAGWSFPPGNSASPIKNHFLDFDAQDVSELSDTVGLVDSRLGNINRCRAAHTDGKLGNQSAKDAFDLRPFGEVRVPLPFFLDGRLLP